MTEPEMDIGEAYALFSVDNRTLKLDLDVFEKPSWTLPILAM